ncbi:NAD-dependent epimerase/dehydratase family protein [Sphingobium sp. 3R8]|uniref:NAD-dependent epimerase/dehydratase family protein n=1 Tax=Sphingobium sp. 3R8 TaxID=2874921 RepID=UPI001CCC30B5|nr:NAD-dependent epimerase/dehydratase family protein [Sphingobium sp. 3R8]MBZ9649893.1 NAD-dependent epimerase/dehydratase family protein [Sphingobium sp. 3R8]
MKTFIFGANGYIASNVAKELQEHGHEVGALARNAESTEALKQKGIMPISGTLTDLDVLREAAAWSDAIVFAPVVPFEEEVPALEALLDAYEGTNKALLYTSGTGVLSIKTRMGEWRQESYSEDDAYEGQHWLKLRVETENMVRRASERGIRAIVMRPPQIWGRNGSAQIPAIFESVEKTGSACYVGAGLNLYTHVHVDDLARMFRLAIDKGVPGALYHAVAGEVAWRTVAEAVAEVMQCSTRSVTFEEAREIWGIYADPFFGVSSRSRAVRSRRELGWEPTQFDLIEDVRRGSYSQRGRPVGMTPAT